jgi:hypothetical protein
MLLRSRRRLLAAVAVGGGALAATALAPAVRAQRPAEATLPPLTDLRAAAREVRRTRKPLLLFFTTPGCPYCIEVRRSYLAPRLAEPDTGGVLIREVSIVGDRRLTGLDGRPLTERALATRFEVVAVPVVRLVDAELKPLSKPLVGLNAAFYESYLQSAIDAARAALARG